jgi:phosphoribosylformylglycinamidine synthase
MSAPQALVLRSAGTNCDGETVRALELAGARAELLHLEALTAEPARLEAARILVIPGGFSYGDYVAAGRIFGWELRHRLAEALGGFVDGGGTVLGICNGFQILIETGLLHAGDGTLVQRSEQEIALTDNASGKFECRWVHLRNEPSACSWLAPGAVWPMPSAHAEGRFAVASDEVLARLTERGQIALRYVTADGSAPGYPEAPNGSVEDIAGICDPTGRVLGLMPHPERNVDPWQHPRWTRMGPRDAGEGLEFWARMVEAARAEVQPS